jgi:hypothetical protein
VDKKNQMCGQKSLKKGVDKKNRKCGQKELKCGQKNPLPIKI